MRVKSSILCKMDAAGNACSFLKWKYQMGRNIKDWGFVEVGIKLNLCYAIECELYLKTTRLDNVTQLLRRGGGEGRGGKMVQARMIQIHEL